MGNVQTHHYREVFDHLDSDHNGYLLLGELLSCDDPELYEMTMSPLFLFKFDESKDGAIDFEEFSQLMKHLKVLQEKHDKQMRRQKHRGRYNILLKEREYYPRVWKTLDSQSAKDLHLDRDTATPAIISGSTEFSRSSSEMDSQTDDEEFCCKHSAYFLEETEIYDNMGHLLETAEGREEFAVWLFKLTDVDKTETITLEKLIPMLKALEIDDIDLTELPYDDHKNDIKHYEDELEHTNEKEKPDKNNVNGESPNGESNHHKERDIQSSKSPKERDIHAAKSPVQVRENGTSHENGTEVNVHKGSNHPYHHSPSTHSPQSHEERDTPNKNSHVTDGDVNDEDDRSKNTNYFKEILDDENHLHKRKVCAKMILDEYDINGDGKLEKGEFLALAKLIIRHYQQKIERKHFPQKTIGNYKLLYCLGKGSSGEVSVGIRKVNGIKEKVAIKRIKRGDVSDISRLDTEIKAMLMLKHPNVVELKEVLEDGENIYFVMDLCGGGSLADYINVKPFSEGLARYYFLQLVHTLEYCHLQGVAHRDLKLENLLVDNDGNLQVSDFGHAGIFQEGWDMFSTQVGCILHLAPEQLTGQVYSGEKMDIWGLGICLYRMLTGKAPFYDPNTNNSVTMLKNISEAKFDVPDVVSPLAQDLIRIILVKDPDMRPSLKEIADHLWCKDVVVHPKLPIQELQLDSIFVNWKLVTKILDEIECAWVWEKEVPTSKSSQVSSRSPSPTGSGSKSAYSSIPASSHSSQTSPPHSSQTSPPHSSQTSPPQSLLYNAFSSGEASAMEGNSLATTPYFGVAISPTMMPSAYHNKTASPDGVPDHYNPTPIVHVTPINPTTSQLVSNNSDPIPKVDIGVPHATSGSSTEEELDHHVSKNGKEASGEKPKRHRERGSSESHSHRKIDGDFFNDKEKDREGLKSSGHRKISRDKEDSKSTRNKLGRSHKKDREDDKISDRESSIHDNNVEDTINRVTILTPLHNTLYTVTTANVDTSSSQSKEHQSTTSVKKVLKVQLVEKQLKFLITHSYTLQCNNGEDKLHVSAVGQNSKLIFELKDGESWEFHEIVEKLIAGYEKIQHNDSEEHEEENGQYGFEEISESEDDDRTREKRKSKPGDLRKKSQKELSGDNKKRETSSNSVTHAKKTSHGLKSTSNTLLSILHIHRPGSHHSHNTLIEKEKESEGEESEGSESENSEDDGEEKSDLRLEIRRRRELRKKEKKEREREREERRREKEREREEEQRERDREERRRRKKDEKRRDKERRKEEKRREKDEVNESEDEYDAEEGEPSADDGFTFLSILKNPSGLLGKLRSKDDAEEDASPAASVPVEEIAEMEHEKSREDEREEEGFLRSILKHPSGFFKLRSKEGNEEEEVEERESESNEKERHKEKEDEKEDETSHHHHLHPFSMLKQVFGIEEKEKEGDREKSVSILEEEGELEENSASSISSHILHALSNLGRPNSPPSRSSSPATVASPVSNTSNNSGTATSSSTHHHHHHHHGKKEKSHSSKPSSTLSNGAVEDMYLSFSPPTSPRSNKWRKEGDRDIRKSGVDEREEKRKSSRRTSRSKSREPGSQSRECSRSRERSEEEALPNDKEKEDSSRKHRSLKRNKDKSSEDLTIFENEKERESTRHWRKKSIERTEEDNVSFAEKEGDDRKSKRESKRSKEREKSFEDLVALPEKEEAGKTHARRRSRDKNDSDIIGFLDRDKEDHARKPKGRRSKDKSTDDLISLDEKETGRHLKKNNSENTEDDIVSLDKDSNKKGKKSREQEDGPLIDHKDTTQ